MMVCVRDGVCVSVCICLWDREIEKERGKANNFCCNAPRTDFFEYPNLSLQKTTILSQESGKKKGES